MLLISFDIDGTLETGEPAGPVLLDYVRETKRRQYIIGSASDRTVREQRSMWQAADITVDFVGHKHDLKQVAATFACARYVHIGDTVVDEHYSLSAGFEFWHVDSLPPARTPGWIY
jgi:hypothetical protein